LSGGGTIAEIDAWEGFDAPTSNLSIQCHWWGGRKQIINLQNLIVGVHRDVQIIAGTTTTVTETNIPVYLILI
jgi:hypothetical protein